MLDKKSGMIFATSLSAVVQSGASIVPSLVSIMVTTSIVTFP
jgi:hypothetical protein